MKKLVTLLWASALALSFSTLALGQEASKAKDAGAQKAAKSDTDSPKQQRWTGIVQRTDKDQSILAVRKRGTMEEKIVHYDSSTKWVSQEHGSKTAKDIDPTQVKDGDRVICLGTYDKKGEFHSSLISKRLTD